MLRALGIYTCEDSGETKELKKFKFAQQDTSAFFPINQLEKIDNILFKTSFYSTMEYDKPYFSVSNNEYHYLCLSSTTHAVLAITSRSELDPTEKAFLFKNMDHILIRPGIVKVTLDDIIANPLGFTGRDLLIGRVQDQMKDVIAGMQTNISMIIARGESLDSLREKSKLLEIDAGGFEIQARKLNSCCW